MTTPQFRTDWSRLVDGQTLTDEERVRLLDQLKSDPELLQEFADERAIDAMLQIMARDRRAPGSFADRVQASTGQSGSLPITAGEPAAPRIRIRTGKEPPCRSRPGKDHTLRQVALAALAATCLVAGSAGLWWWNSGSPGPTASGSGDEPAVARSQPDPADMPLAGDPSPETNRQPPERIVENPLYRVRTVEPRRDVAEAPPDFTKPEVANHPPPGLDGTESGDPPPDTVARLLGVAPGVVDPPAESRLAVGRLRIPDGQGILELDDGLKVWYSAPATVDVLAPNAIELREGQFLLQMPADPAGLSVTTPHTGIQAAPQSELQLLLDPAGSLEAYVDQGEIELRDRDRDAAATPIQLSSNGLQQALITRPDRPDVPALQVVQGGGAEPFQARLTFAGESVTTRSVDDFTRMLGGFGTFGNRNPDQLEQQWQEFARLVRQPGSSADSPPPLAGLFDSMMDNLHQAAGNSGDANPSPTTSFQGSININGQQMTFDTPQAYREARERMFTGELPEIADSGPEPPAELRVFQGEINFNGQRLQFTNPRQFRQFRDRMFNQFPGGNQNADD